MSLVLGGVFAGTNIVGACQNSGTLTVEGGLLSLTPIASSNTLWGIGTLNVSQGGALENVTGSGFAVILLQSAIQLDGASTGSSFNAAAVGNPFTAGIALTPGNIDTGGGAGNPGLQNPRTGSRYAST